MSHQSSATVSVSDPTGNLSTAFYARQFSVKSDGGPGGKAFREIP